ncbi:MAG: HDOD domain-containing protein [Desulfobacteraceae bacterium]|jgi:putative nucleotidyltransferase with HDIG domain
MDNAKLTKILSKVEAFPSMPAAGTKLLALLEEPEVSVNQVEDILRYDPGLTANVLKLANSAFFGIPSRIGSVKHAVILLGLKRLIQLVIASCVGAVMNKTVPGYNIPPGNLWRHAIAVSIAAEALIKDKKDHDTEDFFTPALLHDIGKLVLGNFVKEDLSAIASITAKGIPFVVAENMILGTDHAEIGAKILTMWSFPPEIVDAVRWHHDPEACDHTSMQIDVVHLANVLCQANSGGPDGTCQSVELSAAVTERLGIEIAQFDVISRKVSVWVEELSEALTFN